MNEKENYVVEIPNTVIPHIKATTYWTADDYARLLILHNRGLSIKDIALEMNRPFGAVQQKLKKIKKKFANMRNLSNFSALKRMASEARRWNGCNNWSNCDNCPFPACVLDGYDPEFKLPRRPKMKNWSEADRQHWNELDNLPEKLDDLTLANIFRTSVDEIVRYRQTIQNAKLASEMI